MITTMADFWSGMAYLGAGFVVMVLVILAGGEIDP